MAQPADKLTHPAGGLSNLQKRLLSAAVLLPVTVAAIWLGFPWFDGLVAVFAALMAWEWSRVCARRRNPEDPAPSARLAAAAWIAPTVVSIATSVGAVVFYVLVPGAGLMVAMVVGAGALLAAMTAMPQHGIRALWFLLGVLYVSIPSVALIYIRADAEFGRAAVIWVVALVVAADTGGYLVGRTFGGPKLAPRISPNKTWSGLGGAVLGAALAGLCTAFAINHTNVLVLCLISAGIGLLEQGGDLVESAFKRHFGVKDTSQIIPGHGGVLDRVDGLLAVAVAVLVLSLMAGGSVLAW